MGTHLVVASAMSRTSVSTSWTAFAFRALGIRCPSSQVDDRAATETSGTSPSRSLTNDGNVMVKVERMPKLHGRPRPVGRPPYSLH